MSEIRRSALIRRLSVPGANFLRVREQFRRHPEWLDDLVTATNSTTARLKFGAAKALRMLSERAPDLLYRHFDSFADLLRAENRILKWNATLIVGNLAAVDAERKIDPILEQYLAPIAGRRLIDAANTMKGAAAIAQAKPYLAERIAAGILRVEQAVYDTPECRNVAIGHAIQCLDRFTSRIPDKRAIQLFVARQLENRRPATRRKAENFLRKWPVFQETAT